MKPSTTDAPTRPRKNGPSSLPLVGKEELRAALTAAVREILPAVLAGMGVLFVVLTIGVMLLLPAKAAPIMAIVSGMTAVALFGLYMAIRRWELPVGWEHPLSAAVAGVVLLNNLLVIYLTKEPRQIIFLIMTVIGSGFFLLSTPYLAAMLVAALVGWGLAAVLLLPSSGWWYFGSALFLGTLLSVMVHLNHQKMIRRLEGFRLRDARRKAELETVLTSTEEAQRSLATSMAIGQRVVSILDLDILLDQVASLIQERFRCYQVSIFLIDEQDKGYVIARAGAGKIGHLLTQQNLRLKIDKGSIIGWVSVHHRPVCVGDVLQDKRYIRSEMLPETRSELALPLEVGQELLGVLDMESQKPEAFSEESIPFLQLVADQVAIAINNALLYQHEKSRRNLAETLYNVGRALSSTLNPSEVLSLILERLAEMVPFDRAAVLMRQGEDLEFAAAQGFPTDIAGMNILAGESDAFQEISRTQHPLSIPDVTQRADWQQADGLPPARAWLGIPLIRSDEVIGMLSLTRHAPSAYTADEVGLASTFAGQAAIALHNARLYDQISRFNQDLESLVRQRTEALQQAYDQLERMDRAKSDFINVTSHELRTPLTLLRGYGQMLAEDSLVKQNGKFLAMVNGILSGFTRLHEIVDSMLDVAKIDSQTLDLHTTPISMVTLLRFVCEGQKIALEERRLTLVEDFQEMPPIEADLDALLKVFYQLIANAIKYTPDGGRIILSGRPLIPGEMSLPEGGVEIVISDTGIGIDPKARELIFTKFYQTGEVSLHSTGKTKFKGGGPGLGLSIAKGIVEAHGGLIWVESPGYDEISCPGSQFHVVLPLHQRSKHGN
jgi:signal transduction histidine kinase